MNVIARIVAETEVATAVRYTLGECETRPWGTWEVLAVGVGYTLKRVVVIPGQRLSLQYHNHRSEHWTIVQGTAVAEVDGLVHVMQAGEHIFVPLGSRHRISSAGETPMVFVEVQVGDYLDEQDIVRIDDDYGRN